MLNSIQQVSTSQPNFGNVWKLSEAPARCQKVVHEFTLAGTNTRYIADGSEGELLDSIHTALNSEVLNKEDFSVVKIQADKIKAALIAAYEDAKGLVLRNNRISK